jgi:putative hydrolase
LPRGAYATVLLRALENPLINVIAHPGNPKFPLNVEAVIAAAQERKVAIEINNSSDFSRPGSHKRCVEFARAAKQAGVKVVIGTDSHISTMLGVFDDALKLAAEAGLSEDDIINTSWAKIDKYLLRR